MTENPEPNPLDEMNSILEAQTEYPKPLQELRGKMISGLAKSYRLSIVEGDTKNGEAAFNDYMNLIIESRRFLRKYNSELPFGTQELEKITQYSKELDTQFNPERRSVDRLLGFLDEDDSNQ